MCESPLGLWKKMGDPDILVQKNKLFWLLLSSKDQINGCCGPQMTDGLPLENLGSNLLCHARSVVWVRVPMSLLGIMSIVHHLNSPPYVNSPPSHCPPYVIGPLSHWCPSHWSPLSLVPNPNPYHNLNPGDDEWDWGQIRQKNETNYAKWGTNETGDYRADPLYYVPTHVTLLLSS